MAPAPSSTVTSLISTATSTIPTLAATATSTSRADRGPDGPRHWYQSAAFAGPMIALFIIFMILGYLVAIALVRRAPDAPVHQPAKSGKLKWYRWLWGFNKEDYPSTVPPENRQ
ncbi:hypothetical protein HDU96_001634 [Phlyctochytrium bullatum]|nr:hypothetical protein HDU96_001634 [Phlyctochytrium bullatum]